MRTRDEVGALNKRGEGPKLALVDQGRNLGIEVLRTAVHAGGWDAVEGMLAVVHEGFPLPAAKRSSVRRVLGCAWSVGVWERFEGFVGDRYVFIAPDLAMISVFVRGRGCTFGIGAEELLPAAQDGMRGEKSRVLPLLWATYSESPDGLDEGSAVLVRGLHRLVREAARIELAVPGPHRSEREILYDAANGAVLDRMLDDPNVEFEDAFIRELEKVAGRRG